MSGAPLPRAMIVTPAMFCESLNSKVSYTGYYLYLLNLPQNFRYYFYCRAEIVVSRHGQRYEEDQEPGQVEDDGQGEEGLAKGAVEENDVMNKAISIRAVVIVLSKVAPETA